MSVFFFIGVAPENVIDLAFLQLPNTAKSHPALAERLM
jgi:hypothetical protein